MKRKNWTALLIMSLSATLLASLVGNIYLTFWGFDSYLQNTDEIYIMEAGILHNNQDFNSGEAIEIAYDFSNPDLAVLKERYGLAHIAKDGSAFDQALRLMNEFAPRLTHESNYDNHIATEALPLLAYSLDQKAQGINCRAKAQILNEMCLSLGIYARKVWIMPNSGYDNDCHVVNEIWDEARNKWIMLDITNNEYWVDQAGTPLSLLEIREKGATMAFCTPVEVGDSFNDLEKLQRKHMGDFLYIMKNMAYFEYLDFYTVGESQPVYLLFPKNLPTDYEFLISQDSVEHPPIAPD